MDITELTEIDVERVDGVGKPANGTSFLLIKAIGDAESPVHVGSVDGAHAPIPEGVQVSFDKRSPAEVHADVLGKGTDVDDLLDDVEALEDDLDDLADQDSADDSDAEKGELPPVVQQLQVDVAEFSAKMADAVAASVTIPDGVVQLAKADGKTDCPTCKGKGAIRAGKVDCPDCDGTGQVTDEKAAALSKAMWDGLVAQVEPKLDALKAAGVSLTNTADGGMPGSPEWEAQDAQNLTDAARLITQLAAKLDTAIGREQTEVLTGQSADTWDVWQLQDAQCLLDSVLGIVARLAFLEEAEGTATKAGRRLSSATVKQIRAALEALKALLGDDGTDDNTPSTSGDAAKEFEMTDEELAKVVADALAKADEERQARKAAKKAAKAAELEAAVTKSDTEVSGDIAKDESTVAPAVKEESEVVALLKSIAVSVAAQDERRAKVESTPRAGGPILNGAPMPEPVFRGLPAESADAGLAALRKMIDEEHDDAKKADMALTFSQARMTDFFAKGGKLPTA